MKRRPGKRCPYCNEKVTMIDEVAYQCFDGCGAIFDIGDFE